MARGQHSGPSSSSGIVEPESRELEHGHRVQDSVEHSLEA